MSAEKWFVKSGEREKGPYELAALEQSLNDGALQASALVRAESSGEWVALHTVVAPKLRARARRAADEQRAGQDAEEQQRRSKKRTLLWAGGILCTLGTLRLLLLDGGTIENAGVKSLTSLVLVLAGAVLLIRGALR